MADVATGNVGDTNPQPPPPGVPPNTIDPNEVPSLNDSIQFTQDASDSEDEDNKPSYQGYGLPAIAMTKIQKVRILEHNNTDLSEGITNTVYNNNTGRGRGNRRGGRRGNRGSRGGHNNGHNNDDNTQSSKDINAIDEDVATAKKKKKRGLRKQPTDGKDIYDYAKEMRNGI
ncbi:hypothetical protein PENSOL_c009G10261 [Penicillium solitum]|uniref:Uncharacterized protein n=1 Tax=Penicillium solitum TaxID=60172 RepID=A0A1V6RB46_9EURO|nr:uncharacterized protein PENSOL_c009G10261 [Penicillium solitum]OQD98513.1 hypothetical protein PENSOL_c009G10261 [Penicillium solitum]